MNQYNIKSSIAKIWRFVLFGSRVNYTTNNWPINNWSKLVQLFIAKKNQGNLCAKQIIFISWLQVYSKPRICFQCEDGYIIGKL